MKTTPLKEMREQNEETGGERENWWNYSKQA